MYTTPDFPEVWTGISNLQMEGPERKFENLHQEAKAPRFLGLAFDRSRVENNPGRWYNFNHKSYLCYMGYMGACLPADTNSNGKGLHSYLFLIDRSMQSVLATSERGCH